MEVGLVSEGSDDFGRTRWAGGGATRFELPRLSLGMDGELSPRLRFHGQFDWDPSSDAADGSDLGLGEFFVERGDGEGAPTWKFGAFALPFSEEHLGALRSCVYTLTPSIINGFFEEARLFGAEVRSARFDEAGPLRWRVGFGSGLDGISMYHRTPVNSDRPVRIDELEADGGMARYAEISRRSRRRDRAGCVDWHFAWFDNGGDPDAAPEHVPSDETKTWFFGAHWRWSHRLVLVGKWCEGTSRRDAGRYMDFAIKYALLHWRLDERQFLSARRDAWQLEDEGVQTWDSGEGYTFAWGRRMDDEGELFVEFVRPLPGGVQKSADQDLFQVVYRLRF